ncbi:GTPase Era, mitochondrial [Stomoxys calcitrans]|uniref:GTPase Era, mitochondrial n=1 Tax=Stomoxys calcitrans TaxID=35570 RepID=A0A1I8PGV0_STOCA|nr:GTPase Era, mitochondrial [Stomoxys calcitrans]
MTFLLTNITNVYKASVSTNKFLICCMQSRFYASTNFAKNAGESPLPLKDEVVEKLNEQKSLSIAVIGVPNAGKSTFINNLINHRVCPTSSKVHTTRKSNKAIYTTGQTQLVFYDTPGLVTQKEINKHKLEKSFKSSYRHAIQHADMIAVLHDVSNSWTRKQLHPTVIDSLKAYPQLPSVLILNKIDAIKSKRITLELIRILTNNTLSGRKHNKINKKLRLDESKKEEESLEDKSHFEFEDLHNSESNWSNFSDVFLVSSITGNGLNKVHDYFIEKAKPCSWKYSSDTFTDEAPEDLIVDSVKARLLDYLPQEIPYTLEPAIEYYNVDRNTIYASVEVVCPTKRIERLICGESNGRLRQITERVTSDLVETFGKPISFTISTRPKEKSKEED